MSLETILSNLPALITAGVGALATLAAFKRGLGKGRQYAVVALGDAGARAAPPAPAPAEARADANAKDLLNARSVNDLLLAQIQRDERAREAFEARIGALQSTIQAQQSTIEELRGRVRQIETKEHDCQSELAEVRLLLKSQSGTAIAAVAGA
jgi:hypothetical protein